MERFEELRLGHIPSHFQYKETQYARHNEMKNFDYIRITTYELWFMGQLLAELNFFLWISEVDDYQVKGEYKVIDWEPSLY